MKLVWASLKKKLPTGWWTRHVCVIIFPSSEPAEWLISPLKKDKRLKEVFVQNHSKAFKPLKWFHWSFRVGFGLFVFQISLSLINVYFAFLWVKTAILTFKEIEVAPIKVTTFIVLTYSQMKNLGKTHIKM